MHRARPRRKRIHMLSLVALATAVFTAFSVSPAAAGTATRATGYCGMATPTAFDTLSRLTTAPTAARGTGDVAREPSLNQTLEEVPASAKGKGGPNFRATVSTWVHVVSAGAIGNVSQTAIDQQMTVLNMGFGGMEGGVNTGFRFKLAGVTRTDNATWHYAGFGGTAEREMKKTLRRGDASVLNMYITTAGGYLGWAYFPSTYKTQTHYDGVVIDWESLPGTSTRYKGAYDLGKTATHEVGHWLGLHHVFNGGCNNWGDYVDDTPPQLIATRGCPIGQDSCKEPGIDSIHNYMDYSFDSCYNQYTLGQTARMQDQWLHFRAGGGSTVGNA